MRFTNFGLGLFMASIFQKFGGVRPMAVKLGDVPPSTIMSWKSERRIPGWRHAIILASAERHGIALTLEELTSVRPEDPTLTPSGRLIVVRGGKHSASIARSPLRHKHASGGCR